MIVLKKCSDVSLDEIVTAFNAGFSDYIMKLQLTEELLTERFLKVEQNQLEHSFIAYDESKPIGLMLGGIKDYEGIKTLRCGALCVDPAYRHKGVASLLLEAHKSLAMTQGCERLYLEVIKGNDKAINFYHKHGYQVLSELHYYSHQTPQLIDASKVPLLNIQKTKIEEVESFHNVQVKSHLQWQNDFDFMKFFPSLVSYKLEMNGEIVGLISCLPQGKIFYLWTKSSYRKLGYGKALLKYVINQFTMTKLIISFPIEDSLVSFLVKLGFTKDPISQFDLTLQINK